MASSRTTSTKEFDMLATKSHEVEVRGATLRVRETMPSEFYARAWIVIRTSRTPDRKSGPTSGDIHTVQELPFGGLVCDCEGFKYSKSDNKHCRHCDACDQVKGETA